MLSFSLSALMMHLSACASVQPLSESYAGPEPLPVGVAERFCYGRDPSEAELILVDEKKHYRVFEGSLNGSLATDDDPSPITFEYYEQAAEEKVPVAIVLPILNGQKHIVRPFATYFAKHGYAAIIVDSTQRTNLQQNLLEPEKAIRDTVVRHRQMLDWVQEQPNLDHEQIVVFGVSLGGFNAIYLAALDDRVAAVIPALAAGDVPYVFTRSTERRVKEAVDSVKDQLSMSSEELEHHLRENIETRIMDLAPHINAERVQMVLAKYDEAVPVEKQLELWETLGQPEAITLPTGHITAAAFMFYLRKKALKFFDRVLAEDPSGRTATIGDISCESDS